ncbi:hypothetical protein ACJJTC_008732 [Scirpophaga incertulas]
MASNPNYGLIVPSKNKTQKPVFEASKNIFGNDSDSEEDSGKKIIPQKPSAMITKQAKIAQTKAVIEDPSVFQYDEIYDQMKNEIEGQKQTKKEDKKPRYIEKLLKTANKRKIENERRLERQIQKEREREGDEFADKEVFVTSAYKKKLEEMSLEEEKEKREEYLEKIGDVTKQSDLGGFYRHLYEQKLGSEKELKNNESSEPSEPQNPRDNICNERTISKNEIFNNEKLTVKSQHKYPETSIKRNYRKRKSSSDNQQLSEGEIDDSEEEINRLNLNDIKMAKKHKHEDNIDADSNLSSDQSSDDDSANVNNSKDSNETENKIEVKTVTIEIKPTIVENESDSKDVKKVIEVKSKLDIWKKRTVGEVFDEALKRYYERKAARCG